MKKTLPKVIVFEGGDVCGKTTQLENIAKRLRENGQKVYTFKFPNKYLHFDISHYGKDLLTDEYISIIESLISQNILKCENDVGVNILDIYSVFDALHKYIFNSSVTDIIDNWELIKKLIITDILLNGIDKFIWIRTVYNDIVKNDPTSIILIDRFIDSGNIYNNILPRKFIQEKFKYCLNNNDLEFFQNIINKDLIFLTLLSDKISNILDTSLNQINSGHNIFINEFKLGLTDTKYEWSQPNIYHNFNTLIFESSKYLYDKFKSNIDDINREVTQYDTNEILRQIVSDTFVDCTNRIVRGPYLFNLTNRHRINTDLMISIYNRFCNGDRSCIDFCTDRIMEIIVYLHRVWDPAKQ